MSKDHHQFYYLKRESTSKNTEAENTPIYDFTNYPDDLKKKVVLTQHFVSYLLGEKFVPSRAKPSNFDKDFCHSSEDVYLKKYSRENKAILLRLNNKMIQVIFLDKSELILSSDNGDVHFVTSKNEIRNTKISSDMKSYASLEQSDPSLFKRLNYAKEMLMNLINPKQAKKSKVKQQMFSSKGFKSETKENCRFSRKPSETSERAIKFYASHTGVHNSPKFDVLGK